MADNQYFATSGFGAGGLGVQTGMVIAVQTRVSLRA
jgi:hypothetical protein